MGAGGFLAITCLLFPWSFPAKIVVALLMLVLSMIVAFVKVGDDKSTLEEYLRRRIKFARSVRRYTYGGEGIDLPVRSAPAEPVSAEPVPVQPQLPAWFVEPPGPAQALPQRASGRAYGTQHIILIWLAVTGVYVVYWLAAGGAEEIARWFRVLLLY